MLFPEDGDGTAGLSVIQTFKNLESDGFNVKETIMVGPLRTRISGTDRVEDINRLSIGSFQLRSE
jgi:hypothetical protein